MAKKDKELKAIMQYRFDGMDYALRIVKSKGVDALEKDLEFRKMTFTPLELSIDWVNDILHDVFTRIYNSYGVAVFKVLNETFGFGKERLHRFQKDFNATLNDIATTDNYGEMLYTFSDYAKIYNKKYDMDIDMDKLETVEALNYENSNSGVNMRAVEELLSEHGFKDAADFLIEFMGG